MGRVATLEPKKDSAKKLWYVSVPPRLSPTGKRRREYFPSNREAEHRAKLLREAEKQSLMLVRKAGPELIETAVVYDELFRIYGFKNLKEACEKFSLELEAERKSIQFVQLLDEYKEAYWLDWSKSSRASWEWLRKHFEGLEEKPVTLLDTAFWTKWMRTKAKKENWAPGSYNTVAKRISGIWSHALKQKMASENPIAGVKRMKKRKSEVAVLEVAQAKTIMETAWVHDRGMVPYFAVALFAGLRPESELLKLTWEDINFEERWIRVKFGNKTDTKRFVPIEHNLYEWLLPWRGSKGSIIPSNVVKRRRYILRGKYQASAGAKECDWIPLVAWVRDITRHSYGSYLEGKYKDRNVVKENMGHSNFDTYQQHYRNARTPKQAAEYWAIVPPESNL